MLKLDHKFIAVYLVITNLSVLIHAETLRIAVASNFLETAKILSEHFEQQTKHSVQISSGSSGKLYLQITKGAPFDLFLSADTQKPLELIRNNLALSDSRRTYARGKLALWIKNCESSFALTDLNNDSFHKIAVANPNLAPYGVASQQLLEKHHLWQDLYTKLIRTENISQVAQLAKLGVVDAAFIAQSNADHLQTNNSNCLITLHESDYLPIEQQLIIVSTAKTCG